MYCHFHEHERSFQEDQASQAQAWIVIVQPVLCGRSFLMHSGRIIMQWIKV